MSIGRYEREHDDADARLARVETPFRASGWRAGVRPGNLVEADAPLLALEAMKLETVVRAPQAGQVAPGTLLVAPASGGAA